MSADKLFKGEARFIAGAATADAIPRAHLPEIAFLGRSNVGKSSLINALTGKRKLAHASNTPGRTRQLNFFQLGHALVLVDMPGYGYAKTSRKDSAAWGQLIQSYLQDRRTFKRLCLLIDARRGVMPVDEEVMGILDAIPVSYMPVLTKADKLSAKELAAVEVQVREKVLGRPAAYPDIAITSAGTGAGIERLRIALAQLL